MNNFDNTKHKSNQSNKKILIISIICGTFVILAVIGALIYTNQQNITMQRELKEKEIKAENERSEKQIRSDSLNACLKNAETSPVYGESDYDRFQRTVSESAAKKSCNYNYKE